MKRLKTDDPEIVKYPDGTFYYFGKPKNLDQRIERSLKTDNFVKAIENKIRLLNDLEQKGAAAHKRAGPLFDEYLERQTQRLSRGDIRLKTFINLEWCLRSYLKPFYEKYRLSQIDNDSFEKLRSKFGPRDYQNHRKHLTAFLSWAREKRLITHIPKLEVGKWNKRKRVALTKDEIIAVLSNSHGNLLLFVGCYLFMGMRSAEITRLRWDWIDIDHASIALPESAVKTGEERNFPVNRFVLSLLSKRRMNSISEWVFPNKHKSGKTPHMTDGGFNREWAKMLKRANINRHITPHDLRATYERYAHINPNFTDTQREKMVGASIEVQRRVYLEQFSANELRGLEEAVNFEELSPVLQAKSIVGNNVGSK